MIDYFPIVGFIAGLKPEPRLTVSEWADTHRMLDSKAAAEPGPYRTNRTPYLKEPMDMLSTTSIVRKVIFMKAAQVGAALSIDTPLPTPYGWVTMGEVKVGDKLYDEMGKECTVTFCTEIMYGHDCYEVAFSDGSKIIADKEHRWSVKENNYKGGNGIKVLTTGQMLPNYKKGNRNVYSVALTKALQTKIEKLPVSPYALGAWLGDGNSYANRITTHKNDAEEMSEYIRQEFVNVCVTDKHCKGNCLEIVLDPKQSTGMCKRGHVLKEVGLINGRCRKCHNQRSNNSQRKGYIDPILVEDSFFKKVIALGISPKKKIPCIYLRAGFEQRLELLRGLMDTDGHINKKGHCTFYTINQGLANDFCELVTSLGLKPVLKKKKCRKNNTVRGRAFKTCGFVYVVSFKAYTEMPVAKLKRKVNNLISEQTGRPSETYQRRITSIIPVESLPVKCITVDSPNHLYLCGRQMIPTHNTECGNNWIGYIIDNAPGPALLVQPTDEMVKRNSKMRIAPMIEASPRLREKIKPSRAKDSGNTLTQKEFPGGVLVMTGANSAVGLRSMPARFIFLDEVDGYPMDVDGEGSPISLAEKRASTFSNRKIFEISTPTIDGQSVISFDFELTDKRYYHVPCPFCGCEQILWFENLRWEAGKYENVVYECSECSEQIQERFKTTMLQAGRWLATAPENENPYVVGYHISAMYSPFGWKSWAEIAEEWDKAQGDDNKLKTFYNTILGETWKEKTDAPEWETLYQRAEDYPLNKPKKEVAFITAGVDVQGDRIELELVGWMQGRRSQHLDYRVLLGDTSKPEVWAELDKVLGELFETEDGKYLPIRLMAIDSGYNTSAVYDWAKKYGFTRVIPVKGKENLDTFFSPPRAVDIVKHGKKIGKQKVWHVGVNYIKTESYGFFRQTINPETGVVPEGYCYFPKRDPHYFRGITAEVMQLTRNRRGYIKYVWLKKYDRNEPLDCRVYARAAAAVIGCDRWKPERWEQERNLAVEDAPKQVSKTSTVNTSTNPKPKKRNSFWNKNR